MPTVYIGLTFDSIHPAHIKLIQKGAELGDVTIGLLTDEAISNHKRLPYLNWASRKFLAENFQGVKAVVPQGDWDYAKNILLYKPDYFIHGDDWLSEPTYLRENTINALSTYGGNLIEIPHTEGISSTNFANHNLKVGITTDYRRQTLKRLLNAKPMSTFLEAHSPLSAIIAENISVSIEDRLEFFDGFWSSSLTDSTEMGKPDIEALDTSKRLSNISSIFEVTTKPLIMDADTGGKIEHFIFNVRSMERLGISAVIIEDKAGLKKNSLFGNDVAQIQESPEVFADKINRARNALVSDDFMIIARIESLILDKGLEDALLRAKVYVQAGAHGIMIHSRRKTPDEAFEFADRFKEEHPSTPLVMVPTSYNTVKKEDFEKRGVNILIYANHMLRAAYPAMKAVAEGILINGRTKEIEEKLTSINEILELIPGTK